MIHDQPLLLDHIVVQSVLFQPNRVVVILWIIQNNTGIVVPEKLFRAPSVILEEADRIFVEGRACIGNLYKLPQYSWIPDPAASATAGLPVEDDEKQFMKHESMIRVEILYG